MWYALSVFVDIIGFGKRIILVFLCVCVQRVCMFASPLAY